MKKVYISVPITGRKKEDVEKDINFAKRIITYSGNEPVSPLEVSPDESATYAQHMGNDIAALLECDGVVFTSGWEKSKGCMLEFECARIYGKEIITI